MHLRKHITTKAQECPFATLKSRKKNDRLPLSDFLTGNIGLYKVVYSKLWRKCINLLQSFKTMIDQEPALCKVSKNIKLIKSDLMGIKCKCLFQL